jgi:hypothetical protein
MMDKSVEKAFLPIRNAKKLERMAKNFWHKDKDGYLPLIELRIAYWRLYEHLNWDRLIARYEQHGGKFASGGKLQRLSSYYFLYDTSTSTKGYYQYPLEHQVFNGHKDFTRYVNGSSSTVTVSLPTYRGETTGYLLLDEKMIKAIWERARTELRSVNVTAP